MSSLYLERWNLGVYDWFYGSETKRGTKRGTGWERVKPNSTRLSIPLCFIALFRLHLRPLRVTSSYCVSCPSEQPILLQLYPWSLYVPILSCSCSWALYVPPYSFGRTCDPVKFPAFFWSYQCPFCVLVRFRSYLWTLPVSFSPMFVHTVPPCAPYSPVHTFRIYVWTVLLSSYSCLLRVPFIVPTVLVASFVRLVIFLQDFTILTCAQAQHDQYSPFNILPY